MQKKPSPPNPNPSVRLLDRDESILAFNRRVLSLAERDDIPLLERLRFLTIVSSNLDEFFEVRMEPHLGASTFESEHAPNTPSGFEATATSLAKISAAAHALVDLQYQVFNDVLTPAMAQQGIEVLSHAQRDKAQRRWVRKFFRTQVRPLLVPIALDPAHPFPQVANKSLNFIVQLKGKDAFGRESDIAIVRVPRTLPRLIRLGQRQRAGQQHFVSLSSVIRSHLDELFAERSVLRFSQFRVTRHSDLEVDEDDVVSVRAALKTGLHHRNFGTATRLEVSAGCMPELSALLLKHFKLPEPCLFQVAGPVNLVRFGQLVDMLNLPVLKYAAHRPAWPLDLSASPDSGSLFARLTRGDVLIHQPFESFDAVIALLKEAVLDPDVVVIKQTIYRTGADRQMLDLLCEAVRRGKEVLAVVELKARFDEEANINWADDLERFGAQVVYGVVGLKTHAKMMLITRREGKKLVRYGHLSTGNYNPKTARLYTDIGHLTADAQLTQDMDQVFFHLANQSPLRDLQALRVAPSSLHQELLVDLQALAVAASEGKAVSLVVKMNALTDLGLIEALVAAARAGVSIDLIVRGACMLPSDLGNAQIRIRSIVGRYLEHTRLVYTRVDEAEALWLSSADWMNRNMMRRIELAWPVRDPGLRQRLIDECLVPYLHDNVDAWLMQASGEYASVEAHLESTKRGATNRLSAQDALRLRYAQGDAPTAKTKTSSKRSATRSRSRT